MKRREKIAAALRYRREQDKAPVVVAAGKGIAAEAIEKMAREHGVPLYKDRELARTLTELGLGVEIPQELYEAVARILVHVAQIDEKRGKEIRE